MEAAGTSAEAALRLAESQLPVVSASESTFWDEVGHVESDRSHLAE